MHTLAGKCEGTPTDVIQHQQATMPGIEGQAVLALVSCCGQVNAFRCCNCRCTIQHTPTSLLAFDVKQELAQILLLGDLDEHYGVPVDFIALLNQNATLADTLLQSPQHMLDVLEDALIAAQV